MKSKEAGAFDASAVLALVSALRRDRISADQPPPVYIQLRNRELAVTHNLSVYDASYLELAGRYGLSLKTLDSHLLGLKDLYPFII